MLHSLSRSVFLVVAAIVLTCSARAMAAESKQIQLGSRTAEVIMTKITVSDLRRSVDFYTQVAGLKEVQIPGLPKPVIDNPDAKVIQVMMNVSGSAADAILCLVKLKDVAPQAESAKLTTVVLKTADVRAALSRAKAAGVTGIKDPIEFSGVVEGTVRDPDGYGVTFVQSASIGGAREP